MDLIAAWVLYPLALGVVCLGLGLLVGRVAGWELPGVLLVPVGVAALLAYARLVTASATTAKFGLALLLVLTVAGIVLGRARLRTLRPDPWLAAAALGLFVVYAAPVVMTGTPTFAGYLALPDTSHQLSLAWLLAHHGPDLAGLPASSLKTSMDAYLASRYPIGGQAALGVTGPLGVLDLAWLYQPFLTFLVVATGLALAAIAAPLVRRPWQVALVAFAAAQPALVVGFALQGSIKEIAALATIVTLVAVLAAAILGDRPARSLVPIAIAAAAGLGALGPAIAPYLAVPALVVVGVWGARLVRRRERADAVWLGLGVAAAVVAALPVLGTLGTAITIGKATLISNAGELGNLAFPLDSTQALGPWLTGDYRYPVSTNEGWENALLWLFVIAGAVGLVWALRRRGWGAVLLAASVGIASLVLLPRGGPYADAKVLMILSPIVPMLAMVGAASLWRGWWRIASAIVSALLIGGLLWSSALAYHDVSTAPYDRYAELLRLNDRLAEHGPVLLDEYDEFGKYFLRDPPGLTEPENVTDYRGAPYKPNALVDPRRRPTVKTPWSIDDVTLRYLESVPYIILRRSPTLSRPPANFRLAERGRFYDLWQRTASPRVLRHDPLGRDVFHPAARVTRAAALSIARAARRAGGRIAYVRRAPLAGVFTADIKRRPGRWVLFGNYPGAVVPAGPGSATATVRVARPGAYRLWVEGSFARRMTLSVDDRVAGRTGEELNNPGEYTTFGPLRLARGPHSVTVSQGGGDLRPGSGGYLSSLRHVGAMFLVPAADERLDVRELDPDDWRRLVGVNADWLEVVGS